MAKAAVKDTALVAGFGRSARRAAIEPLSALSYDEAKDAFKEQIRGLVDGGVDLLILETFGLAKELEQAIRAAKEVAPDLPLIVQFTVNDDGALISGASLESGVKAISGTPFDVIGLNCSIGPRAMLEALEHLKTLTSLPISVQPNAGVPQNVSGRYIYMTSPEYVAEYTKRFIQTGRVDCRRVLRHQSLPHPRDPSRGSGPPADEADRTSASPTSASQAPETVRVYERPDKSRLSSKLVRGEFVTLVELVSPRGVSPVA